MLFVLCSALFFCSQFFRASNAIIAPQLQQDLALTPETLGLLSASFFYAFAFTQIPLALFLDRLGARVIMTVLTLVSSLGACIFAMSDTFHGAVIGRVLLGFGMAGNLMGGMKLFTQWFSPKEFATLSGLLVGSGTLGNLAASSPLALLVGLIGWRWSFISIGILTAAVATVFYAVIRDEPNPAVQGIKNPQTKLSANIKYLLTNRDYWLISCGAFFRYGTLMAIQGLWAGPYLMGCFNLSPVQAGNIIMLTTIGYVVGCSGGGWLSDRVLFTRKYVVIIGLAGMALADLSLTNTWCQNNMFLRAWTFFSLGLFSGFGNVMYAHIKGIMPPRMTGMALTGINFFTMLGVGAYIHIMGLVLNHIATGRPAGAAFFLALAGVAAATGVYFFTHDSKEFQKEPSARS
jgi:nitrate/nitrite transporter NarK